MQSDFTFEIAGFSLSFCFHFSEDSTIARFSLVLFPPQHEAIGFAGERRALRSCKSMPSDEYFIVSEKEKQQENA